MRKLALAMVVTGVSLIIVSCANSPFVRPANPQSLPVKYGVATTNDSQVTAWLELARKVNSTVNVTPTEPALDVVLNSLVALSCAAAGWFGRHASQPKPLAQTTSSKPPV